MGIAKPDEDGFHQTATVRPLSRCAACSQHTSDGALYSWGFSGPLWYSEASTQQSLLVSSCIHHPLLVLVSQVLPKFNYGAGFLIGQAKGCVTPELHQIFGQLVHMLVSRDILVVNSLLRKQAQIIITFVKCLVP